MDQCRRWFVRWPSDTENYLLRCHRLSVFFKINFPFFTNDIFTLVYNNPGRYSVKVSSSIVLTTHEAECTTEHKLRSGKIWPHRELNTDLRPALIKSEKTARTELFPSPLDCEAISGIVSIWWFVVKQNRSQIYIIFINLRNLRFAVSMNKRPIKYQQTRIVWIDSLSL